MTHQPELTITIPRSKWLRGSTGGRLATIKDDAHCFCIMGFIGEALGLSPADMLEEEDFRSCRVQEEEHNAYIGKLLLDRGLMIESKYFNDDHFDIALTMSEAAQRCILANDDDKAESEEWRESYLAENLLNSFNIVVNFVDDKESAQ